MAKGRRSAGEATPEDPHSSEGNEVYDAFVAELEARRKKLRLLLRMVKLEAQRTSLPPSGHSRCRRVNTPTA